MRKLTAAITFSLNTIKQSPMNNAEIIQADILLNQINQSIGGRSMLDIKYKVYEDVKIKLYNILSLLQSKPALKEMTKIDFSRDLLDFFNINYPEWQRQCREKATRIPRQMLQYFLCKRSVLSLKSIGELTGGQDHTTVMHSRELVKNMLTTNNQEYIKIYNEVIEFLKSVE